MYSEIEVTYQNAQLAAQQGQWPAYRYFRDKAEKIASNRALSEVEAQKAAEIVEDIKNLQPKWHQKFLGLSAKGEFDPI